MFVASTEQLAAFVGAKQAELAVARVVDSPPDPVDRDSRDSRAPTEGIPPRLADAEALLLAQEEGGQGRTREGASDEEGEDGEGRPKGETAKGSQAAAAEGEKTDAKGLTEEEQAQVQELQKRDAVVRRHERAHAAAAGPHGGSPSYEFQRGPGGQFYAVGGEVSIDVSAGSDAAATIAKMEIVIRAALAPADPSGQDRSVAAQARRLKADAERELREEKAEEATIASEKAAERRGETTGNRGAEDASESDDSRNGDLRNGEVLSDSSGDPQADPFAARRAAAAQSYGRTAETTTGGRDPLQLLQALTV